jgi:NADH-quinone oxidoreductase subunit G
MCDQGRLSYRELELKRLEHPVLGKGSQLQATAAEAVKEAAAKLKPLARSAGLAVMASPVCSNEVLLAALSFANDSLGATAVYVSGRPEGKADELLMTADKNPNRKGLEYIAQALGLAIRPFAGLAEGIEAGKVKALYAIGAEVPMDAEQFARLAGRLELLVLQSTHAGPLLSRAQVVLPMASHLEDEGSFVQLGGIIQRFCRAYLPPGARQPGWWWATELGRELGSLTHYQSAHEVWKALASKVPELAMFDWEAQAPKSQKLPGINPLPAAADGRLPGFREFGLPRAKES